MQRVEFGEWQAGGIDLMAAGGLSHHLKGKENTVLERDKQKARWRVTGAFWRARCA